MDKEQRDAAFLTAINRGEGPTDEDLWMHAFWHNLSARYDVSYAVLAKEHNAPESCRRHTTRSSTVSTRGKQRGRHRRTCNAISRIVDSAQWPADFVSRLKRSGINLPDFPPVTFAETLGRVASQYAFPSFVTEIQDARGPVRVRQRELDRLLKSAKVDAAESDADADADAKGTSTAAAPRTRASTRPTTSVTKQRQRSVRTGPVADSEVNIPTDTDTPVNPSTRRGIGGRTAARATEGGGDGDYETTDEEDQEEGDGEDQEEEYGEEGEEENSTSDEDHAVVHWPTKRRRLTSPHRARKAERSLPDGNSDIIQDLDDFAESEILDAFHAGRLSTSQLQDSSLLLPSPFSTLNLQASHQQSPLQAPSQPTGRPASPHRQVPSPLEASRVQERNHSQTSLARDPIARPHRRTMPTEVDEFGEADNMLESLYGIVVAAQETCAGALKTLQGLESQLDQLHKDIRRQVAEGDDTVTKLETKCALVRKRVDTAPRRRNEEVERERRLNEEYPGYYSFDSVTFDLQFDADRALLETCEDLLRRRSELCVAIETAREKYKMAVGVKTAKEQGWRRLMEKMKNMDCVETG